MSENTDTILELRGITKSFGGTEVLRGISLAIRRGEFITFLGSSGCGKTTTLRIIAGLESPDSGAVLLGGSDVTNVEPNKRDVNTIFQNYALFPHMDVFHNIAYSLKLRHVAKDEVQRRVTEMLTLVQLEGYEKRMPSELSGGQKQRVAIARAVINNPSVLLLDEPLGALDLQLRRQMQAELKRLQKQLGITFLYITHDQEEAINMSDRIVVMNEGQFEQIGSPSEIYDNPRTSFVAGFVGTANLLTGIVKQVDTNTASVSYAGGTVLTALPEGGLWAGEAVTLCVRSENVLVSRTPREGFCLPARVVESSYSGGMLRTVFSCGDTELIATRHGIHAVAEPGGEAFLSWEPENAVPVDRGADDAQR